MTHALETDLYQLTMVASYFHRQTHDVPAVCEMFVRRLPKNRRFLVAAGLDQVLDYLERLRFTDAQIDALKQIPGLRKAMTHDFVEYLRAFRFRGDVWALPEGTVFFENEPILRIEAPLAQAQLVETFLLSTCNFQTGIASKAARVVLAAGGRPVLEFGTRRTHGAAAVDVARAAYIAGFEGTSNVEAFERYQVPARGTMAHMYIMASSSEEEAFRAYGQLFKESTYLVDTYDTLRGVERVLDVVGEGVSSVRIDSGDLAEMSRAVRKLLDDRGRSDVEITLSSDLDEYALQELGKTGSWNAAGVGTRLATCDDAPSLGGVYKLVQIDDRHVAKFSEDKVTYPGAHQVYRHRKDGQFTFDHLGMLKELSFPFLEAEPLLEQFMEAGRVKRRDTIHDMRSRCRSQLEALPDEVRTIGPRTSTYESFYEVRPSERLVSALEACRQASENDADRPNAEGEVFGPVGDE